MAYRVNKWADYFEGAKSKGYNNKTSCQMPTKHGLGFRRMVRAKNGPGMFGAFCAMVQYLSRQPKPREGWVTEDGKEDSRPLTPDDLEMLTDIPSKLFASMLELASSEGVAWVKDTTRIPRGYHKDAQYPLDSDSDSDSDLDSNSDSDSNSKVADHVYSDSFLAFWDRYPKKTGKEHAFNMWNKRGCESSGIDMVERVEAWRATEWRQMIEDRELKYIPNCGTWINSGSWEDMPDGWVQATEEPCPPLPDWGAGVWSVNIPLGSDPVPIPDGTHHHVDDGVNRPDWFQSKAGDMSCPHRWYCIQSKQGELPL